jgi:hypothetical protein
VSTLHADPVNTLSLDFSVACRQLGRARLQQREKDTPDHRAAVAECLARIDAYLDMKLDLEPVRAARPDRACASDGRLVDPPAVRPIV